MDNTTEVTLTVAGQTVKVPAESVSQALIEALQQTGADSLGPISRDGDGEVVLSGQYFVIRGGEPHALSRDLETLLQSGDTIVVETKHDNG